MLPANYFTRPLKPSSACCLLNAASSTARNTLSTRARGLSTSEYRSFSASSIADPSNKLQVYRSLSTDPFINLSIEHHLLTKSSPDSRILLLYSNRPSVIIGRNQNPWLEVNLPLLARIRDDPSSAGWADEPISLVRRRSGGGAVFHDAGNVNFSVICPPAEFDRDKHALMVVRALNSLGRSNTRVNERHDIVMDIAHSSQSSESLVKKISGSAYKLTRLRALHHGTCLLQSPNLGQISPMLRSPAAPHITALGSPSVRSPVANVGLEPSAFIDAVIAGFRKMYGGFDTHLEVDVDKTGTGGFGRLPWHEISKSVEELRSKEWIYGQTPRFSFNSVETSDTATTALLPPTSNKIYFESRHGKIEKFEVDGRDIQVNESPSDGQVNKNLWECSQWPEKLSRAGMSVTDADTLGHWLHDVLGTSFSTD